VKLPAWALWLLVLGCLAFIAVANPISLLYIACWQGSCV